MCGLVAFALLVWSFVLEPWPVGATADWVVGLGTLSAVVVALWQSTVLRRLALDEATDAANRLRQDLTAAQQRMDQELNAAEQRMETELNAATDRMETELNAAKERMETELSAARERLNTELEAAENRHRIELDHQRELARVQRVHLREQEFKLALIRVTRAVNAVTHMLATLTEEASRVVDIPDRQDREDALLAISEKLGILIQDVVVEVSGAHMLTQNDALHEALNQVLAAVMSTPIAEMAIRDVVIQRARMPQPNPVPRAQQAMQAAVGDARQMAGDLLVTGWD